jgi:uncharacterized protein (DUF2062 family)
MVTEYFRKFREVLLHHILHTQDTAHRLAMGAAIGMFIAWTPTFGVQMVLAVALATLFRANKAVTIPMVWLTNPVTNVPIYAFAYAFGHFLLTGTWAVDPNLTRRMMNLMTQTIGFDFYHTAYWSNLSNLILQVGIDLWLGGVILGLLFALVTYPLMYWAVIKCRAFKKTKRLLHHIENESDISKNQTMHPVPPASKDKHHAA